MFTKLLFTYKCTCIYLIKSTLNSQYTHTHTICTTTDTHTASLWGIIWSLLDCSLHSLLFTLLCFPLRMGFPDTSAEKEAACFNPEECDQSGDGE